MIENELDFNLKLLAGSTIQVGNIPIKPKTLREIVSYGYTNYSKRIGILSLNVSDLVNEENMNSIPADSTVFDIILSSNDRGLIAQFVESLTYFLDEDYFDYDDDYGLIIGEVVEGSIEKSKYINHTNYNDIVDTIRYQNCVKMPKADSYNPADEKARLIIEKLQKGKEAVNKAKAKNGEAIDFMSVVSSVSTKSNSINKFNVWDLNIYQLYDEFKRLEMIQGYETSILAMLNGADIRDLKHWSSKIED